jgi:dipeptidyl aminopeptidase/acylaminoacyl peptidase
MIALINRDTLSFYAYTSAAIVTMPIKGIVVDFHGLGGADMMREPSPMAKKFAAQGYLYVFPYYGPWSWMNKLAVKTVDAIIDAVFAKYALAPSTPIVHAGGSMGGLAALVYTRYAQRRTTACAANCPVCDLVFHRTEREDLPRTLYSAFADYGLSFETAIKTASPVHLAPEMPFLPYFIAHCAEDHSVNQQRHSAVFVAALRQSQHQVEYVTVPQRGHCDLDDATREKYDNFIMTQLAGK